MMEGDSIRASSRWVSPPPPPALQPEPAGDLGAVPPGCLPPSPPPRVPAGPLPQPGTRLPLALLRPRQG